MFFELNADTAEILGKPNFVCGSIAQILRSGGHDIEKKAEAEQAAVIYWLLTIYDEHGSNWAAKANGILQGIVVAGPAEPGKRKEEQNAKTDSYNADVQR